VTVEAGLCELLPWDSEFFGVRVARIRGDLTRAQIARADDWCRHQHVSVAYLLLPTERTPAIEVAEDLGFHCVDIRVVLASSRDRVSAPAQPSGTVRPHQPSDTEALERIARNAHRDSRFYADPHFPRERCDALYATWIRRSCEAQEVTVLVAERDGDVAGYLTYRPDRGSATLIIELVGVAEDHRGHGVGAAMVGAGLGACLKSGAPRVEVATQGRNVGAQHLYQRAGMTTASVSIWLHKWYG
jgi:dTDP-4-amino-4,6-dideoxy-D-galactose acyltransferase